MASPFEPIEEVEEEARENQTRVPAASQPPPSERGFSDPNPINPDVRDIPLSQLTAGGLNGNGDPELLQPETPAFFKNTGRDFDADQRIQPQVEESDFQILDSLAETFPATSQFIKDENDSIQGARQEALEPDEEPVNREAEREEYHQEIQERQGVRSEMQTYFQDQLNSYIRDGVDWQEAGILADQDVQRAFPDAPSDVPSMLGLGKTYVDDGLDRVYSFAEWLSPEGAPAVADGFNRGMTEARAALGYLGLGFDAVTRGSYEIPLVPEGGSIITPRGVTDSPNGLTLGQGIGEIGDAILTPADNFFRPDRRVTSLDGTDLQPNTLGELIQGTTSEARALIIKTISSPAGELDEFDRNLLKTNPEAAFWREMVLPTYGSTQRVNWDVWDAESIDRAQAAFQQVAHGGFGPSLLAAAETATAGDTAERLERHATKLMAAAFMVLEEDSPITREQQADWARVAAQYGKQAAELREKTPTDFANKHNNFLRTVPIEFFVDPFALVGVASDAAKLTPGQRRFTSAVGDTWDLDEATVLQRVDAHLPAARVDELSESVDELNWFQKYVALTPTESRANTHGNTMMRATSALTSATDNPDDIVKLLSAAIQDTKQLFDSGIPGDEFVSDSLKNLARVSDGSVKFGAGMFGNQQFIDAMQSLRQSGIDVNNLPSIVRGRVTGVVDKWELELDIFKATQRGAARRYGGARIGEDVPVGTIKAEAVQTSDGNGKLVYKRDDGVVIGESGEYAFKNVQQSAVQVQKTIDSGEEVKVNPLRVIGSFQRSIMSLGVLNTRLGSMITNSVSLHLHSLVDGNHSLQRIDDARESFLRWTGGGAANIRNTDAWRTWSDALGNRDFNPLERRGEKWSINSIPIIGHINRAGAYLRSGPLDIRGTGIAFGEESGAFKAGFKKFEEGMHILIDETFDTAIPAIMQSVGIEDSLYIRDFSMALKAAAKDTQSANGAWNKARQILAGAEQSFCLDCLSPAYRDVVSPELNTRINGLLRGLHPDNVNEVGREIAQAFTDEITHRAHLLTELADMDVRVSNFVADRNTDIAELMTHAQTVANATGQALEEVQARYRNEFDSIISSQEQVRSLYLSNWKDPSARGYMWDVASKVDAIKRDVRGENQKLVRQVRANIDAGMDPAQAWEQYDFQSSANWAEASRNIDSLLAESNSVTAQGVYPPSNTVYDLMEQLSGRTDEELLEAMQLTERGAQGDRTQLQPMVEAGRELVDKASLSAYSKAAEVSSPDAVDLLLSTERNVYLRGSEAAARRQAAAHRALTASEGASPRRAQKIWEDYRKEAAEIWGDFFQYARATWNSTTKQIIRNGYYLGAKEKLSWTDDVIGAEGSRLQLVMPSQRSEWWQVRDMDTGALLEMPESLVPVQVRAVYREVTDNALVTIQEQIGSLKDAATSQEYRRAYDSFIDAVSELDSQGIDGLSDLAVRVPGENTDLDVTFGELFDTNFRSGANWGPTGDTRVTDLDEIAQKAQAMFDNSGGLRVPDLAEVTQYQIDTLREAASSLTRELPRILNGAYSLPDGITPTQVSRILDGVSGLNSNWNDMLYTALDYGERMRSFTAIDFLNSNYIDDLLGLVTPYHFWTTRTFKNWVERSIFQPQIYSRMKTSMDGIEVENDQQNLPNRFRGTIAGPLGYRMRLMPDKYLPYLETFILNGYDDPARANSGLGYAQASFGQIGLNVYPHLEALANWADGKGHENFWAMGNPHLELLGGYAPGVINGEATKSLVPNSYNYNVANEIALRVQRGTVDPYLADLAMDYYEAQQQGWEIAPEQSSKEEEIQALIREAEGAVSWTKFISRSLSAITGISAERVPEGEQALNLQLDIYRNSGFNSQVFGSQLAGRDVINENPAVGAAFNRRDVADPSGDRILFNAVRFERNRRRQVVYEEQAEAVAEAILDGIIKTKGERFEFKKQFRERLEAIDDEFPSFRQSGDFNRFNERQNPFEMGQAIVEDILAYELPGEPVRPTNESLLPEYYRDLAEYRQLELAHKREAFQALLAGDFSGVDTGGVEVPELAEELAQGSLIGKYTLDLMRAYELRHATEIEALWDEDIELERKHESQFYERRRQRVLEAYGQAGIDALDGYRNAGPSGGQERRDYRRENPEVFEYQIAQVNPALVQEARRLFGDDILLAVATYPSKKDGYPKADRARWKSQFGDDSFERMSAFWDWHSVNVVDDMGEPPSAIDTSLGQIADGQVLRLDGGNAYVPPTMQRLFDLHEGVEPPRGMEALELIPRAPFNSPTIHQRVEEANLSASIKRKITEYAMLRREDEKSEYLRKNQDMVAAVAAGGLRGRSRGSRSGGRGGSGGLRRTGVSSFNESPFPTIAELARRIPRSRLLQPRVAPAYSTFRRRGS